MSTRVSIQHPARGVLQIELRQEASEVIRFMVFVAIVAGALYALAPAVRSSPGWLVVLTFLATTWATIAVTAREVYTIDIMARSITAERSSVFGNQRQSIETREVAVIDLTTGGPDNNRRLVALIGRDGSRLLRLPGRMTTLSEADQTAIGAAISDQLGVPCRTRGQAER